MAVRVLVLFRFLRGVVGAGALGVYDLLEFSVDVMPIAVDARMYTLDDRNESSGS